MKYEIEVAKLRKGDIDPRMMDMIKRTFPFPELREGQAEIIEQIFKAYMAGKRYVILEAGTGTGKSPIAIAVSNAIGSYLTKLEKEEIKRKVETGVLPEYQENGKLTIEEMKGSYPVTITKSKILQTQYEESFLESDNTEVAVLWGVKNYPCKLQEGRKRKEDEADIYYNGGGCQGFSCPIFADCHYIEAKEKFQKADTIGVTNNSFYTTAGWVVPDVSLLVVDEAHLFVSTLIDRCEFTLETQKVLEIMENYNLQNDDYLRQCIAWEQMNLKEGKVSILTIVPYLKKLVGFVGNEITPRLDDLVADILQRNQVITRAVQKILDKLTSEILYLNKLSERLELVTEGTIPKDPSDLSQGYKLDMKQWVCWCTVEDTWKADNAKKRSGMPPTPDIDKSRTIHIKPTSPLKQMVEDYLEEIPFVVYMSATIGGKDQFIENMKLDPTVGTYIEAPTTFPPESRRVVEVGLVGMNYRNRKDLLSGKLYHSEEFGRDNDGGGEYYGKIVSIINSHQNQRGLIHSVSYVNAVLISEEIEKYDKDIFRRLVVPPRGTQVDKVYLEGLDSNAVIISPSLSEGVDLSDDLCRFQIILKVPYLSLGDVWTKTMMENSSEWYSREARITIMQMVGRGTRSAEDYCVNYFLDNNFLRLKDGFPSWFLDSCISDYEYSQLASINQQ